MNMKTCIERVRAGICLQDERTAGKDALDAMLEWNGNGVKSMRDTVRLSGCLYNHGEYTVLDAYDTQTLIFIRDTWLHGGCGCECECMKGNIYEKEKNMVQA